MCLIVLQTPYDKDKTKKLPPWGGQAELLVSDKNVSGLLAEWRGRRAFELPIRLRGLHKLSYA